MFNLEKFAEQVLPKDPTDANAKLAEAIEKLNENVGDLQKKIEDIKPTEPEPEPDDPKEPDGSEPAPKEEHIIERKKSCLTSIRFTPS